MAKVSEREKLIVSMKGSTADQGAVPAFTSLESVHGLAQALMMIVNFAQSGEIRRRNFKDLDVDVRLVGTRAGSFEFVLDFSVMAPFLYQAYGEVFANASWDLVKTVLNRVIGLKGEENIEAAESDGRISTGDLGALIQAVEPSVKKAHSVVNYGARNINIFIEGDHNRVSFDAESKEYIHDSVLNDRIRTQRFLVTSFDGRNRTGRLFDLEAEQAFTFDLLPEANRKSLKTIVNAASAYALREKGHFDLRMEVICAFTSIDAPDGRKKRLKVSASAKDFDGLEVASFKRVSGSERKRLIPPKVTDDDEFLE